MMKQQGGHSISARFLVDDIPVVEQDILNRSTITAEISDTETGLVLSRIERPMRSFTANFLRLLWGRMTGLAATGGKTINNDDIDETSGKATNLKCVGATTGLKKFGICIGTGTGAVAQSDYALTWDTGFSTYGATTLYQNARISASEIFFSIRKQFVNNTGATRTVEEVGIVTTGEGTEADNNSNVLIARDLLGSTNVGNGQTLTLTAKIGTTFTTDGAINRVFMESLEKGMTANTGTAWRQLTASAGWAIRYGHTVVEYGGKLYQIGGNQSGTVKDDVYSSNDGGATWTQVRASGAASGFLPRANHVSWVYGGKMWVGGGQNGSTIYGNVYYSTDGATWTQATAAAAWATRRHATAWVYDSKMWIGFGANGTTTHKDVFYSTDGITWTNATTNAAPGQLLAAGGCVFAGKMWISGGDLSSVNNKVHYSTDGATWTQATASAAWSARYSHCMVSSGVKMYVYAGTTGLTGFNDLYESTDGATWSATAATAGYGGRWAGPGIFHRSSLMVFGGYNGAAYLNDVWGSLLSAFDLNTGATMNDYARIDAASGAVYGITAGTGTTNFNGNDGVLITPIADGSGASKLVYGDMTDAGRLSEPTVTGADNVMRLERDFTNNSGGSITIKEVGLSAKGLNALGLLLMRGKVDKAVADGSSVRVAIELRTTV